MPFTSKRVYSEFGRRLYDRFPGLRDALASAWGYRLQQVRYGRGADQLACEAAERDQWSAERWREWQREKVGRILRDAAARIPYYRDYWEKLRVAGDRRSCERLEDWPILEKNTIRAHGAELVLPGAAGLSSETTSGTTGNPIRFWMAPETTRSWYAISEARWRGWNGVSRHDRWALFGAQLVVPRDQAEPPFWVRNHGLNQLYLSTYHLSDATAARYVEAIREYGATHIWGLSSALHRVAFCILERGLKPPPLRVVLTSSEPVLPSQRAAIEQAFQCPVRETYGMSEKAAAASECEHGRMHLWPDVGFYEVVNGDRPAAPGETGELLCTSLINSAMPLIRYRVGDLVRLAPEGERCPCGRTLPLLEEVVGRSGDVLHGSNGRMIPPSSMEAVFDTDLRIREGQIVQEAIDRIRVRYVPAPECDHRDLGLLESRIQERMGPVRVTFEQLDGIPRTRSGKFQAVRREMDSVA